MLVCVIMSESIMLAHVHTLVCKCHAETYAYSINNILEYILCSLTNMLEQILVHVFIILYECFD